MKIITLDLAKSRTGWAIWHRGWAVPRYGSVVLGSEYATDGQAYGKLHEELAGLRATFGFETIYYEQAIDPRNLGGSTNIKALTLAAGLAAHVESFATATRCRAFGINVMNWRKDFISADLVNSAQAKARAKRKSTGKKASARDELKRLTKARCEQLGFAPKFFDEADAIGILDYALDFHEHITPPWRADEVLRPPLGDAA